MAEVLAVGDERFRDKCLASFRRFQKAQADYRTSSARYEVQSGGCDRAIVIDEGKLVDRRHGAERRKVFRS